jgi:hypothetical protein
MDMFDGWMCLMDVFDGCVPMLDGCVQPKKDNAKVYERVPVLRNEGHTAVELQAHVPIDPTPHAENSVLVKVVHSDRRFPQCFLKL